MTKDTEMTVKVNLSSIPISYSPQLLSLARNIPLLVSWSSKCLAWGHLYDYFFRGVLFEPLTHSFFCRSVDLMCSTEVKEEAKPEIWVKAGERAIVSGSESQKQNKTERGEKKKQLWRERLPLHPSTQTVRQKSAWLIICHLFTLNSTRLDGRVEQQQRNKWRKFTLWDARQEQKLERYSLRERKTPVAAWQTELTYPQKTAGFIDICLRCLTESPGGHLRLWYCISFVLWLSKL